MAENSNLEHVYFVNNPIKCNQCNKVFAAKSTLTLHIELTHQVKYWSIDKDEVTSKANNSTNESKIEQDIQTIVENLNASKLDLKPVQMRALTIVFQIVINAFK